MKGTGYILKYILFFLLLFLLVIPVIQSTFKILTIKPLKGVVKLHQDAVFTMHEWLSGDYQKKKETYLNEHFGFRNSCVRIYNQLMYSAFKKAKANGVVIGKESFLYEEQYIDACYGYDFIGKDSIEKRMQQVQFIADTLSKLNKNIILVFAPGKASFYPEYIPDRYKSVKGKTNLELYLKYAKEFNIPFLDFNTYFISQKDKSEYALFPRYGIHWSSYGESIAADSIIRFIETLRAIDMPEMVWKEVDIEYAKDRDYDIADGMNLLCRLQSEKMGYPEIQFQAGTGKIKPSAIVIADSYYWGMFNFGISAVFSEDQFWYYNEEIYPASYTESLHTGEINLGEEIRKHDVLIIMATDAFLPNMGWGFIENVYRLFHGIEDEKANAIAFKRKVAALCKYIKSDKKWMEQIEIKAKEKNISNDSMVVLDATWAIEHEMK